MVPNLSRMEFVLSRCMERHVSQELIAPIVRLARARLLLNVRLRLTWRGMLAEFQAALKQAGTDIGKEIPCVLEQTACTLNAFGQVEVNEDMDFLQEPVIKYRRTAWRADTQSFCTACLNADASSCCSRHAYEMRSVTEYLNFRV